ncbi:MAG: hypothetical protein GY719_32525 [bacterium]|nr:hypothetical protein [bacterium]
MSPPLPESSSRPGSTCWWLLFSWALVLLLPGQVAPAAGAQGERRPRIGLALSGGGARGCAHVGVLKVLEEMRIPVDYVAGTSMGAIVGGLYASGLSAAEIEQILSTMDWAALGEDQQPRRDRAYRRKEDDQRYVMNLEIGLDGFVLPRGLRSGQRFTFELRRHTWPVVQISDFSELPIPFKAVAVDLETGERVPLDRGSLATAMRASMSIPGVFTPVELDGRLLVDGGIVANLPIDVVREMGADFVIAVNIGDQLVGREELGSMLAVTEQAMTISSAQSVAALLPTADLVLTPEVAGRGSLDFTDVAGIIGEGEKEARRRSDLLADLTLDAEPYARYLEHKRLPAAPPRLVSRVDFRGLERVDHRIVRRAMRTRPGEPLDLEVLRRDLGRIHGLGDFELVDFEVVPGTADLVVVVVVREKRGGPFFLRSALNLDLDEDQNTSASFLLNLTAIRLNALGLEWRTDAKVGSQQRLESELYQPLDLDGRWFVAARVAQRRDLFTVFAEDRPAAELEQVTRGGALDLGLALGTFGEIRLGAFRERREQSLVTGQDTGELQPTVDLGGWQANVAIDRLDSIYFPRSGQLGALAVVLSRPEMGADDRYELGALTHVGVVSSGRHTLLSWVELGAGLGDDQPPYAFFGGGGLFSFSGYSPGELLGASVAVLRPTYLYRLGTLPPLAGKGIYLGGWLEAGNYWSSRDDASLDDLRFAATLGLGAETVIGPAYLALGLAEHGRSQIYLSIGPSLSTRPR